jgi:hypothetical protein
VDGFAHAIATLRSNGVVLEEYDEPGFRTDNGVWRPD